VKQKLGSEAGTAQAAGKRGAGAPFAPLATAGRCPSRGRMK